MIIVARNTANVTHIVMWRNNIRSSEWKEKTFPTFKDANGFAMGLTKKGMSVRMRRI